MASHSPLVQSVVALILFVAMAFASADNAGSTVDVIQAITKSIEGRKDLMSVRRYLGWSTNLHLDFPVTDGVGYTFFAPTNGAIGSMLPQDVADPFFVDPEFRRQVLLRHFTRQNLSKEDLTKLSSLTMVDSSTATLTQQGDVTLINDAKIVMEAIQLEPANLGTVYVINRIFTTFQEIEAVMDKNRPQPGSIKDQAQSPA